MISWDVKSDFKSNFIEKFENIGKAEFDRFKKALLKVSEGNGEVFGLGTQCEDIDLTCKGLPKTIETDKIALGTQPGVIQRVQSLSAVRSSSVIKTAKILLKTLSENIKSFGISFLKYIFGCIIILVGSILNVSGPEPATYTYILY